MSEYINSAKLAVVGVLGALTGLWGWLGWLVLGWLGCMVLDYLTGSMAAAKGGAWSSAKAREGIWHKAGMIVVVVVAAGADLLIGIVLQYLPIVALPIQYPGLVCPIVLVWYIITELGSMAENAADMGAPVPSWLLSLLAAGKAAVDQAGVAAGGGEGDQDDADLH